jgi:hypothetical protein
MLTPPNVVDLTWLSVVKTRAEVKSSVVTEDSEIQAAITAFSSWLLYYTGQRTLNTQASFTETYSGNGNNRLFLRQRPVTNVAAVVVNGVAFPQSGAFGQWGYYIEDSQASIAVRGGLGNFSTFPYPNNYGGSINKLPAFQKGTGNIQVTYTAGFPPVNVTNDIETVNANTVTLGFGPWVGDIGVTYYPSLTPLVKVASAPAVGQYAVSNGLYVFNNGDNTNVVALTYSVNQAPPDLEYAVRCVVAINYKRKGWQDLQSRGTTSGGTSATTRYANWMWPPEYQAIFDHYRRLSAS